MELPFPNPVEGLCVNLVDYLKWRGENSHVGLGQLWNDEPRIWVPSTEGLDDMPLNARLQGRREHTAPLVFRLLDLPAGEHLFQNTPSLRSSQIGVRHSDMGTKSLGSFVTNSHIYRVWGQKWSRHSCATITAF